MLTDNIDQTQLVEDEVAKPYAKKRLEEKSPSMIPQHNQLHGINVYKL
jgi:hypothetical protein